MAIIPTIATVEQVRWAGGIDQRVDTDCLKFYLQLTSHLFRDMIGDTNYDAAINDTLEAHDRSRLEMAEALLTVGFSYPAIAAPITQVGLMKNARIGVGGQVEIFSPSKEVMEMAANFLNMGKSLVPATMFQGEAADNVWHEVVMQVFPGTTEIPTVADIGSEEEADIKTARGDYVYSEEGSHG